MKFFNVGIMLFFLLSAGAQSLSDKLSSAINALSSDGQFRHATIAMYVVDSKTGKVIFDKNAEIGLAPASCQKVITSVSAFELLGKDYQYKTDITYSGNFDLKRSYFKGSINITGYGDPTLGSWRFQNTRPEYIINNLFTLIKKNLPVKTLDAIFVDNHNWGSQTIPDGWIWQDMGNYYGAGCSAFNWNENQYTIQLKPGRKEHDKVQVISAVPYAPFDIVNELTTGTKGSGDKAYIYCAPYSNIIFLRGTVPAAVDSFFIAGSSMDGSHQFENMLTKKMQDSGYELLDGVYSVFNNFMNNEKFTPAQPQILLTTLYSPKLDSINYWFLKKSVNLYGEAFVKTIAFEKTKLGITDTGIAIIKNFWSTHGIDKAAINIIDGSGLSPANRVTTNALVTVMQYAKNQNWFSSFYNALPEINNIKMKDGYIGGVRSYTGFIKSKDGHDYTFSFIANNFDGSPGTVREKMWRVLDLLK